MFERWSPSPTVEDATYRQRIRNIIYMWDLLPSVCRTVYKWSMSWVGAVVAGGACVHWQRRLRRKAPPSIHPQPHRISKKYRRQLHEDDDVMLLALKRASMCASCMYLRRNPTHSSLFLVQRMGWNATATAFLCAGI